MVALWLHYGCIGTATIRAKNATLKKELDKLGFSEQLCILKYFVKKEKIRSIVSWVQKLTKTKVPKRVYETLYISWNVTKSIGGRQNADAIATYVK